MTALAVSQWTLREASIEVALGRIADAGFRAVELGGQLASPGSTARALRATGLQVSTVCPLLGADNDLASPDARVRMAGADVLRRWVDAAGQWGAQAVIVVPSDRVTPADDAAKDELLQRSADSIAAVVADGSASGPQLVIEPLNRYETHLVRTLQDAARLAELVDHPAVALMADVFHLNIEEDDVLAALRRHAGSIRHLHLADNQRREPGSGTIDFARLRQCLDEIGYTGTVALECLPADLGSLRRARQHLDAVGWAA